jgi:hypothetical protein
MVTLWFEGQILSTRFYLSAKIAQLRNIASRALSHVAQGFMELPKEKTRLYL